ncbi:YihY/virulence factor BrkB family protein [Duganella fentianensis]|uniref:YihY/virulence factor BrkB family protein n=1 Tax=Duganella fentianensis TaxID=2692177 RepID=UPI0032B2AA78
MRGVLASGYRLLHATIHDWLAHRAASKGAALAFYTLFSLAPVLLFVLAIAGSLYGVAAARGQLFGELRQLLGRDGAQAVELLLAGASNPAAGHWATALAAVILLVGATTVFAELKASLDEIWQIAPARDSALLTLIRTRLLSLGMILVLAFLLLVSLAVSAALSLLDQLGSADNRYLAALLGGLNAFFTYLVISTLFAAIFKLLPQVRLAWRDVLIGALGTAALFTLGKHLIGVYIGHSALADSYGAASAMVALLLWVYYSAQIFFLGAEFTRQYAMQHGSLRAGTRAA